MRIEKPSGKLPSHTPAVPAGPAGRAATRAAKRPASGKDTSPSPTPSSDAVFHAAHGSYRLATYGQLQRSTLNVRRRRSGDVGELAALIRSQGLLQNLICYEEGGMLHVIAGERRLAAIGQLIDSGDLPVDFAIACLLVPVEEAVAISLAENSGREAMHPADVFDAMRELAARGAGIHDIAVAFGVSALTVRRRLKLANVAPRFMAMYRDDAISFEQLAGLAICDDHATQEQVWDSLDKWSRSPANLRRLLTAQHVDVKRDRLARYVGVSAIEAAGGIIIRDLFGDDDDGYVEDAALLLRLATDKLTLEAAAMQAEGWAWVAVQPLAREADLAQYGRVRMVQRELTEAEREEVDALQAAIAPLRAALDDLEAAQEGEEGEEAKQQAANAEGAQETIHDDSVGPGREERPDARIATLQREWDALDARLAAINAGLRSEDPAERALAGAVVTISESGALLVLRNLIRPSDRPEVDQRRHGSPASDVPQKVRPLHSERLVRNLTAQRTLALHAQLMARPAVALAVLVHDLVRRVFYTQGARGTLTGVSLTMPDFPEEVGDSRAMTAVNARRAELSAALAECPDDASLLAWMLGQSSTRLLELLAFCIGSALDTVHTGETLEAKHVELARAVELDMRAWWQPTAANYWQHVPKGRTVDVVAQTLSPEMAQPLLGLAKEGLVQRAEQLMSATGWLPPALHV